MKKWLLSLLLAGALLLGLFRTVVGATEYPSYDGYVNDFAEIISPETEKELEHKLLEYDSGTTNQVVVATFKTLSGVPIEEFSIGLAGQWKPGTDEKDNGVILLIAKDDREFRIEVGRGLEGEITDIEAKDILDNVIGPEFKEGRFDGGVTKGVDAIITSIATDSAAVASTKQADSGAMLAFIIFLLLIAVVVGFGFYLVAEQSSYSGSSYSRPHKSTYFPTNFGTHNTYTTSRSSYSSDDDDDSSSGGGISFGGGKFSGGGSSSKW